MSLPENFTELAQAAAVSYKWLWDDDWTPLPWALGDYAEFAAGPEIDKAQITWFYGNILYPGAAEFEVVEPLDLQGAFILLAFEAGGVGDEVGEVYTLGWLGRVIEPIDEPDGKLAGVSPSGTQRLVCWGLGHDLDQVPIISTVLSDDATDPTTSVIARAVGFNMGKGDVQRDCGEVNAANSTNNPTADGCYAFSKDLHGARLWGLADAATYLLTYYVLRDGPPADGGYQDWVPWQFYDEDSVGIALGVIHWKEHTDGKSTFRVICDLFTRKRAMGFYIDPIGPDPSTPTATVIPFTMVAADITLGTVGITTVKLPKNPNTVALDFTADAWIGALEIRETQQTQYDQVIARGERKGSVFTVSGMDGTIEADWSDDQQTQYNDAASTATDYSGLADWQKQQRNDAFRQQRSLERVYCWWRLPVAWDGQVNDGEQGADWTYAFPTVDQAAGTVVDAAADGDTYWLQGLRFQSDLPFYTDVDYSGTGISAGTTVNNLPSGAVPQFMPLVAAVKLTRADGSTHYYAHIDRLTADQSANAGAVPYLKWNASVSVQDQAPGVKVKIHSEGRAQQHRICLTEFTAPDTVDKFDNLPDLDWNENLLLTVYAHADSYAECRVPADSALDSNSITRLVIDVPDAYMDYVAPGTVVGIKDGKLLRSSTGGFVRNDFDRLKKIANIASGWFCEVRHPVTITYKRIALLGYIGDLITTINGTAINTVITSARYDFQHQTTTVQTSHAELDVFSL